MNCRQVTRRLSAYADGELTGIEMLEIRRHMMDCQVCREEFEAIRNTKVLVSRLATVRPSAEFVAALSAKLDEIQIPAYQRFWNSVSDSVRGRLTPVATAFVAVSVGLVVLTAGSIDEFSPAHPQSVAQIPPVQLRPVDALNADVLPVRNADPFYNVPASTPFGGAGDVKFLNVSFGP